jgi:hypothetical protein
MEMANWQSGGVCYESKLAAAGAYVSSWTHVPAVTSGTSSFVGSPSVTGSETSPTVSIAWTLVAGSDLAPGPTVLPYVAQPCGLIGMDDAVVMAWAVIAVWVVGYSFRVMKTMVRT